MTLKAEVDNLLKYHIESPQFSFYYNKLIKRMDSELYNEIITREEYNKYLKIVDKYRNSFKFTTEVGIPESAYAYYKMKEYSSILEYCSPPMIKYLRGLSQDILSVLKANNDGRFTIKQRCDFLIELLTKANNVLNNSDREVYFYINQFKLCMIANHITHGADENLQACYKLFFTVYNYTIEKDKDFYDYYWQYRLDNLPNKNPNDTLSKSSVFSDNSNTPNVNSYDLDYFNFMKLESKFFEQLIIPNTEFKYTKDAVIDMIFRSNIPNELKDEFNNRIMSIFESIYYPNTEAKEGFSLYNSYGDDFVYFCTDKVIDSTKELCNHLIAICDPFELIKYCVYRADFDYMNNSNSPEVFNNSLLSRLLDLEQQGLITDSRKIFKMFER